MKPLVHHPSKYSTIGMAVAIHSGGYKTHNHEFPSMAPRKILLFDPKLDGEHSYPCR